MFWLTIEGFYYRGDQQNPTDIQVPERPTLDGNFYMYDRINEVWVLDPAKLLERDKQKALADLAKSDQVAIRALKDGILFPDEWKAYCTSLRFIVNASHIDDYSNVYPSMPSYPEFDRQIPNLDSIKDLSAFSQVESPENLDAIQILDGSRDVMISIESAIALDEITLVFPSEGKARINQKVQFRTRSDINKINWAQNSEDTGVVILDAPSMLNSGESGVMQRVLSAKWTLLH